MRIMDDPMVKRMELFYSEDLTPQSKQIQLSAEESRHLRKALRRKAGEQIRITNGLGLMAEAVISDQKPRSVLCEIQSNQLLPPPLERNIHIALSTIRPNRQDWAVEKLTELGIGTISFFHSQFTSVKSFKAAHLKKIAVSAIKQSGQAYLPQIQPPLPFTRWIGSLPTAGNQARLIAHLSENEPPQRQSLSDYLRREISSVVIAIGPEGGLSEVELETACENGFLPVTLDNHILRTETAAVVAAALAKLYLWK